VQRPILPYQQQSVLEVLGIRFGQRHTELVQIDVDEPPLLLETQYVLHRCHDHQIAEDVQLNGKVQGIGCHLDDVVTAIVNGLTE
jgi:hypothetical protein